MKLILTQLLMLGGFLCQAQSIVFTEDEFIAVVKKHHPVLRQVLLDVQIAEAEITVSRGKFDPLLNIGNGQKELGGLNYYNQSQTEIKIPVWYGADVYAGRENATGSRLNPEETKGTLNYIGVSVPVLQNLLMDKRRATLQQAIIYKDLSVVEQRIVRNDLLLEALIAYWEWWEAYHVKAVVQNALQNAEKRFSMVKTAYRLGDRPAIDTLEALTQIQTLTIRQNEALADLIVKRSVLSTFLWTEGNNSYELAEETVPQEWTRAEAPLLEGLLFAVNSHPEALRYNYKLSALRIDKKLKFQSLLPQVNLKYHQIGKDVSTTLKNPWFQNDYRFGVAVSVPLRLSEGRGLYRQAKLKIDQTLLEQVNKRVQLTAKIKQAYTEWQQRNDQVAQQTGLLTNTVALQRGEETRFANGESSLFLINAREIKSIETSQKLVEIKSKSRKALIKLNWAAGLYGN